MEWISVEDRLPIDLENKELIVAWASSDGQKGSCGEVYFINGEFVTHNWHCDDFDIFTGVTHWMSLPEPPQ